MLMLCLIGVYTLALFIMYTHFIYNIYYIHQQKQVIFIMTDDYKLIPQEQPKEICKSFVCCFGEKLVCDGYLVRVAALILSTVGSNTLVKPLVSLLHFFHFFFFFIISVPVFCCHFLARLCPAICLPLLKTKIFSDLWLLESGGENHWQRSSFSPSPPSREACLSDCAFLYYAA